MIARNRLSGAPLTASLMAFAGMALAQAPVRTPTPQRAELERAASDVRAEAQRQELEARKQPKKAAPKVQAAKAYEAAGDVSASRVAAADALSREANNVEAMQVLARLAAREGNYGEAAAHLRRAVLLDPNNAATQLALGQALEKTGDQAGSDAAYAAYRSLQGMKALPNDAPATR